MIIHCAYIRNGRNCISCSTGDTCITSITCIAGDPCITSFETVGLITLFLKNNDDNFIVNENNIYSKKINKNYSVIYVETHAPATLSLFSQPIIQNQNQLWKISNMKHKLMAEIKIPDTIIRCKIIEKQIRRKLHIEVFELFAHEMNIDYVFENLKLFDYW